MEDTINGMPVKHFYLEKDGITYTEKNPEMKLKDGLITEEEYNEIISIERQKKYQSETDNLLLDFVSLYLESRKDTLTKSELELWKVIEAKKKEIKEQYPKQS